ncbi:MAG TPA: hypothetical protein VMD92_05220 [Acidobacteriaceae bacterium]|nr:hypothetical protein [Acidobacteriaceae bacterium]
MPARQLDSITVSPATASGSQVQFTATSHWSAAPATVTPQAANWVACGEQGAPTKLVTVSSGGLAQCASGATGTFIIYANHPAVPTPKADCNVVSACGGGCGIVTGSAQLTCP